MEKRDDANVTLLNTAESPNRRKLAEEVEVRQDLPLAVKLVAGGLILLQATLIVLFLVHTGKLGNRLTESETALVEQTQRMTELTQASTDLRHQVEGLQAFISTQTSEDVLYLKINILKPALAPELARAIAEHVHFYATFHGQDPDLVLALMAVESNFDPNAVSPVGAEGLMQIMPQWKKVLGISDDLKDPETSIKYGLQILGFYKEMYKETEMALTAYNRGPGPVDMALMRGKDHKNGYSSKVLAMYDRLNAMNVGKR